MKRANGMGSIINLGKNRRRPYATLVTTGWDENGKQIRKYIGYSKTKKDAEMLLLEYYKNPAVLNKATLENIYDLWSKQHFLTIGEKTISGYKGAWKKLSVLKNMNIRDIKTKHLQDVINEYSTMSRSTLKDIKSLSTQLFKFAMQNDLAEKDYTQFVTLPAQKDKKEKEIFNTNEIETLWKYKDNEWIDSILFMIYTGDRVGEMLSIPKSKVNLEYGYIQHGNKTETGKQKITPIHKDLLPLIQKRMITDSKFLFANERGKSITTDYYRKRIYYPLLKKIGIRKLTPHSCRHTFASLLNKSEKNKNTISRLMGHTDYSITAKWYTHDEITELIDSVNKL